MKKYKKRKLAYIPTEFDAIVSEEIKRIKKERKTNIEPTQIEAWDRIANRLMKDLIQKPKFKIKIKR